MMENEEAGANKRDDMCYQSISM